tara:strand:+ start:149 stop:403 length:255 start_codon:yes stop_codon:yes gene_type:complete
MGLDGGLMQDWSGVNTHLGWWYPWMKHPLIGVRLALLLDWPLASTNTGYVQWILWAIVDGDISPLKDPRRIPVGQILSDIDQGY